MLLLVDGYNVTMRDPKTSSLSKEGQREALVARLRSRASALAPRGTVVVVFDAREGLGTAVSAEGAVTTVFAPDADTEIVRRCSAAKGNTTVVTDDLRLRARISQDVGRHVRFRDAGELFDAAGPARARARDGERIAREVGLPSKANEITEELKKVWLTEEDE
jgi:predicted RNA-binding protein with PIN domain